METAINALISLNEQTQNRDETLAQVGEILSRAGRGVLESVYHSLSQYPPSGHFFLWVALLEAESQLRDIDVAGFIRRVQVFLSACDKESVKLAVGKYVTVVRVFTEKMIAANKPMIAIRSLKVALNKLSPSSDHLTPIHPLLAQVCLLSKNYKAAVQVLDREVLEVDPGRTGVQPLDALLYFYYGGMVYIGLKQFRKAQDFFVQAISAPAQAVSAVVIESHRKYVLVSLLLDGQLTPCPKYTSSLVLRHVKSTNQSYLEFAKAYQTHKQDVLRESFTKCLPDFVRDKNTGLASQVVESLYRRNILRLTQTYVTLSLADIATSVQLPGPKFAEDYLLRMIEEGFIHAKIDQKEGMVSFQSNPEQYSSNKTLQKLDTHIKAASSLGNRVDELQKKISLSPAYLRKLVHEEKGPTVGFDDTEFDGPAEKHHGGVQLQ